MQSLLLCTYLTYLASCQCHTPLVTNSNRCVMMHICIDCTGQNSQSLLVTMLYASIRLQGRHAASKLPPGGQVSIANSACMTSTCIQVLKGRTSTPGLSEAFKSQPVAHHCQNIPNSISQHQTMVGLQQSASNNVLFTSAPALKAGRS